MTENLEDRDGLLYIEGTNELADGTYTSLGEADAMYSEFSIKKGKRHGLSIVYWSNGKAIAIGFGKTPISLEDEIRLADKCKVWGSTKFDLKRLKNINSGCEVSVEKY